MCGTGRLSYWRESFGSRVTFSALVGAHIGLAGGTVVLRVAGTVRAVQTQGAGPAAAERERERGESEGSYISYMQIYH